ncbi:MAG: PIG-L family deacetylase, partial [Candidatus Aminicenantaceae bacterium]
MKKYISIVLVFLLFFVCNAPIHAQKIEILDAAELQMALQKLNVLGSVLYYAAHPDDENTAALAYFSKGRQYRTAYLSVTRGDGGQNLIGPEKGAEIGILRTQELLSARKIDGAEQFFTRAIDFGYSKTPEETFEFWGKEEILADIVWIIRKFRPDVIITRFSPNSSGGHGHHSASGPLIKEAFLAASNPNKFPEQLKYVKPWQAKRLLWNTRRSSQQDGNKSLRFDTGEYNPILGKSYTEMAAESRSNHKSKGFGSTGSRGTRFDYLQHAVGDPAQSNLFDGIDTYWNRVPGGRKVGQMLAEILKSYDPQHSSNSISKLIAVYAELLTLDESYWGNLKKEELVRIIQSCAGLWIEAIADDFSAAPGDDVQIKTTIVNRSNFPFKLQEISFPGVSSGSALDLPLK